MPQPGRPGNLTAEQEAKLKEFWKTVFKVFGVTATGSAADDLLEEAEDDTKANGIAATPEKEKKKRRNIFSRKKKNRESNGDDGASIKTSVSAADQDDKYGQTKEFFEALANNTPEDLHRTFWTNVKSENPDGLLLRFLRARKWDIEKALVMMISTMQWRHKTMDIEEDVVFGGEASAVIDSETSSDKKKKRDAADFLDQMHLGKSFVHGKDREGRPLTVIRVRLHHGGDQTEKSIERFTVFIFETVRLLLEPPADTGSLIFDMTGFTLANMDYTPIKFMAKCFEANYPESLGVCIVHKAPWIFQGIWKIIKGWLDPVVAAKVKFTNSVPELEEWVDRSNIMKEMGGDDPFEYKYIAPREGENKHQNDKATKERLEAERAEMVKKFEELTTEWITGESSPDLEKERTELAQRLMKSYWDIDPYVRARSLYDRIGVLSANGHVDWSKVVGGKSASMAEIEHSIEDDASSIDAVFATPEEHPPQATANGEASKVMVGAQEKLAGQVAAVNINGSTAGGHDPDGVD